MAHRNRLKEKTLVNSKLMKAKRKDTSGVRCEIENDKS